MKTITKISILLSFFLVLHKSNAFNITQILTQYPDFSNFNSYLTQTNLAGEINSRQTITILAVDNGNLSPVSGKTAAVLKNILSVHVILDYFDVPKLQNLRGGSAKLTTLFQTSGQARGEQGFLNVTHLQTGAVAFGSAVAGSTPGSNLVKSVSSQPYNISVLQVSNVIVPPGVDGSPTTTPPSSQAPSASPQASATPSMSPNIPPPNPAAAPVIPPTAGLGPAPINPPSMAPAVTPSATPGSPPVPADAPVTDGPTADSPEADVPAAAADAPVADVPAAADAPVADVPAAAADAPGGSTAADTPNGAGAVLDIGIGVVMAMASSTVFLVTRM